MKQEKETIYIPLQKEQHKKGSSLILPLMLLLIIGAAVWLWYTRIAPSVDGEHFIEVRSDTAVYDLRDFDFENAVAAMSVHEEFIEGELLTPEEFEAREEEALVGVRYSSPVTTSRMTYLMPDDGRYIITDRSLDFCERIYVNGELIQEVGTVALTAEESVPHHAYLTIEVRPENGVLEIVRQGNNFVHIGSNIASTLTLGTADRMHKQISLDYGLAGVVVALFFTMTAIHLLLYTVFRRHTAHLYFAILTFVWGFRMGVTGIVLFGEWIPTFSWYLGFRIQQFTWPMAAALVFLIALHVMPSILPGRFIKVYAALCTAFAVSCFFLSTMAVSIGMIIFQIINVVAYCVLGLAAIVCLVRMARAERARTEHVLFVLGLLPLAFSILNDTLYDQGRTLFDARFEMGDLAMFLFVILQTAALFYDSGRKNDALAIAEQKSRTEAETLRLAGEMKEEFIRTLSHELQVPVAAVSSAAQLSNSVLREDEVLDRALLLEQVRVIDHAALRVSGMVSQLLDASAIEMGSFRLYRRAVDMEALIQKAAELYFPVMQDGSITLTRSMEAQLPVVYGDEERLLQTVLNLLSNAIKHSGGDHIAVSAVLVEGFVRVTVADNGRGIAPGLMTDLWSRYPKERSGRGNGLGLYIVAQTIRAHDGSIEVESAKDKGTMIHFTVPIGRK